MKNGRYSVFESTNGDGKIQFLIENTTITVFLKTIDYGITVIIEKINGNTVILSLVRPPIYCGRQLNYVRDENNKIEDMPRFNIQIQCVILNTNISNLN